MQHGGDSILFKKRLKIYFTPNDLESDGKHESPHEYIDPRQTYHVERIVDDMGGKEQKYYELIGFRNREGKIIPRHRDDHEPILLYLPINDETKDGVIYDKTTDLMKKYGKRLIQFHRKTKSDPVPKKHFVINDVFQHSLRPGYEVRPEMLNRKIYSIMNNSQSDFILNRHQNETYDNNFLRTLIDYTGTNINKDITFGKCTMDFHMYRNYASITAEDNKLQKMISELEPIIRKIKSSDPEHIDVITFDSAVEWINEIIFANVDTVANYYDIITRTLNITKTLETKTIIHDIYRHNNPLGIILNHKKKK